MLALFFCGKHMYTRQYGLNATQIVVCVVPSMRCSHYTKSIK